MAITNFITSLALSYPVAFLIVIILVSLTIMIKSADMTLFGISKFARKFGISDYLIGLIAVALGASMPELASAVTGGFLGDGGIVFGTILGSNLIGVTVILGIMALVGKKIPMKNKLLDHVKPAIPVVMVFPLLLIVDGVLSRIDGLILIALFFVYLVYVWKKEGELGKLESVEFQYIWKHGLVFILALAALLLSARWTVFSSIELARRLGISSFIVATFVIGVGAQIPDFVVSLRAQLSGHQGIGLGNLLGSSIAKITLFLGVVAVLTPVTIPVSSVVLIGSFIFFSSLLLIFFMREGWLAWWEGVILIGFYVLYAILQLLL